jgi:hypothetical protein
VIDPERIARDHAALIGGLLGPRASSPPERVPVEAAEVVPDFTWALLGAPARDAIVTPDTFRALASRRPEAPEPEGHAPEHEGREADLGDADTFAAFAASLRARRPSRRPRPPRPSTGRP